MFDKIRELLAGGPSPDAAREHQRIQVAMAALLLEMAHADEQFHEMEGLLVRDLLQAKFDLEEEAAAELLQLAQQERESSLDLYHFAREINATFSREEKLEVMEGLWRIIYADGMLDKYEDHLVRRLATLLRLSHREMIGAKVKVLDELRPER